MSSESTFFLSRVKGHKSRVVKYARNCVFSRNIIKMKLLAVSSKHDAGKRRPRKFNYYLALKCKVFKRFFPMCSYYFSHGVQMVLVCGGGGNNLILPS